MPNFLKNIFTDLMVNLFMYPNHLSIIKTYFNKYPTQDKLVSSSKSPDFPNLFNPATDENEDTQNPSEEKIPIIDLLKTELDLELRKVTEMFQYLNSGKLKDFHSEKLAKHDWSIFSAMVEIYHPNSVKEKYNEIRGNEHPDWNSYFEEYYSDFISQLESEFPSDEHKAFYENRVYGRRQVQDPILLNQAKASAAKKEAKKEAEKSSKEAEKKEAKEERPKSKPKKTLLEQAQDMAKGKKVKTKQVLDISYPVVFDKKAWKKFWSNSKLEENSNWRQFSWNCNSIGQAYLMNNKDTDQLTREYDVNQDFCVLEDDEEMFRILMFDGVSQSRAPRQWAEFLAMAYIEQKMNLIKLKEHSKDVIEWHKESIIRWNNWIEKEYLPKRTHLPLWRIKNEVTRSFTTFISIEITPNKIEIANLGDSAVFCKLKSGKLKYLPNTYNHLFRPKNISTEKLYKKEDIEFLSIKTDQIDSLLACTDSIADYIFDKDEEKMKKNLEYCLENLSLNGNKFNFMAEMIGKGPSNDGWLEDDITFFSFVTNEKSQNPNNKGVEK